MGEFSHHHEDERGEYVVSKFEKGNLPGINIIANTVPAAWELAVLSVWYHGAQIHTHYDKKDKDGKFIDAPSKEATVTVEVSNPFNEPMIHKNFPGGPEELEVYRQEVVNGIHDHWIKPQEGKWTYTYHERLFNYNPSKNLKEDGRGLLLPKGINQIEKIVDDLQRDITSKGSQATTWMPSADPGLESNRPCLQRLWFRVLEGDDGKYLNMNVDFRSRDLYKAWFMNVHALRDIQKKVANDLSARIGEEIKIGTYRDKSDSLHIYGAYMDDKFKDEIQKMYNPNMENRVWSSDHPAFEMMTQEAKEKLAVDPDCYAKGSH